MELSRRQIDRQGTTVSYLDTGGKGPVVVFLHGLAESSRVTLVGQSMGAHTALLAAARRPDLVSKLILLEATVHGGGPEEASQLGDFFRSWPVPFTSFEAARSFLGDEPLARAWIEDLEACGAGLCPRFLPEIMESTISEVQVQRWGEWRLVAADTVAVFAHKSVFTKDRIDEFIAARPQTHQIELSAGTHDAHLDASDEWIEALRDALRHDSN